MRIFLSIICLLVCLTPRAQKKSINQLVAAADSAYKEKRYEDAFAIYGSVAPQSDYASLQLGKMIYQNKIRIKEYKPYLEIFYKLAAKGNMEATAYLGLLYFEGKAVAPNIDTALLLLRNAEKANNPLAFAILGIMHFWGKGLPHDIKKSKIYLEKAISLKEYYASSWLSALYENGDCIPVNMDSAIKYLELGCLANENSSYSYLGYHYLKGKGVDQNTRMCIILCKDALIENKEDSYAAFYLSQVYADAGSEFYDPELSKKYLEQATKYASPYALSNFGKMYMYQAKPDTGNGFFFLRKALAMKEPFAALNLGIIYNTGYSGTGPDKDLAKKYFLQCVELGLPSYGHLNLGNMAFKNGDYDTAENHYKIALSYGDKDALVNLGLLCSSIYSGQFDIALAKKYFKEAADNCILRGQTEYDKLEKDYPDIKPSN